MKRGYTKDLNTTMVEGLKQCFGTDIQQQGDHYQIRYGALTLLDISIGKGGKTVIVTTQSDKDATDEVILDTNRRFRRFLDMVTGYTTKERVKKAKSVGGE